MELSEVDKIKHMIKNIGRGNYKDGSSTKIGWLYHPIPFSEFNNIPVHKNSTIEEFNCIKKDYGSFKDKNILDVGCANGYFSFNMALENSKKIISYEGDKDVFDVNEEIKKYKNFNNIFFINKYFNLEESYNLHEKFDIILLMNIHMWIRKQIGEIATFNMMKNLKDKTNILYFQTAHKGSGGGYQVPELKSKDDVYKYLKNSGFKNVDILAINKEWFNRFLFRCSNV